MNRRDFLVGAAAFAGLSANVVSETPRDVKITRIRISTLTGRFPKFVAMNAYDRVPKGDTYTHTLFRFETNSGHEGIAPGVWTNLHTADYAAVVKPLIGARLSDLYTMQNGMVTDRAPIFAELLSKNRHLDYAFFDILGKLHNIPVWKLIGDRGKTQIPVYDGTVYFADVLHKDRGADAVVDECHGSLDAGFRAVKIKLGRGSKWMPGKAGDDRDVEVSLAARRALGPDVQLMADPNYGYAKRYDDALGLMRGVKPAKLLFMEEIFPETPELYTRLRSDLAADSDPCKIAFGEHFTKTDSVDPYLKPQMLVDFAQPDVRSNGILDVVTIGRKCEAAGAEITGHNWASQLGAVMALHLSRALPNYGLAENDRSTCEVFDLEPLKLKNGCTTVPPGPGLGIRIRNSVYDRNMAPKENVVS